jgi:hypothetical protein
MVGPAGWRAIAAAGAAACAGWAALGDKVGAPTHARIAFAVVAALLLGAVVVFTVGEETGPPRAERERRRGSLDRLTRLARGVRLPEEQGEFFTGRVRLLREIVAWLGDSLPESALCAIVGGPGSGKSAVLGRLVVGADPRRRAELLATSASADTLPSPGAIDLFVDARDQSVEGVAALVGGTAGVRGPPDQVIDELVSGRRRPFVLAVDALDEAGEQAPNEYLLAGVTYSKDSEAKLEAIYETVRRKGMTLEEQVEREFSEMVYWKLGPLIGPERFAEQMARGSRGLMGEWVQGIVDIDPGSGYNVFMTVAERKAQAEHLLKRFPELRGREQEFAASTQLRSMRSLCYPAIFRGALATMPGRRPKRDDGYDIEHLTRVCRAATSSPPMQA